MCIHYIVNKPVTTLASDIKSTLTFQKKFIFYCDYFERNLETQLKKRKLNEEEIWTLIDCICKCMYYL